MFSDIASAIPAVCKLDRTKIPYTLCRFFTGIVVTSSFNELGTVIYNNRRSVVSSTGERNAEILARYDLRPVACSHGVGVARSARPGARAQSVIDRARLEGLRVDDMAGRCRRTGFTCAATRTRGTALAMIRSRMTIRRAGGIAYQSRPRCYFAAVICSRLFVQTLLYLAER